MNYSEFIPISELAADVEELSEQLWDILRIPTRHDGVSTDQVCGTRYGPGRVQHPCGPPEAGEKLAGPRYCPGRCQRYLLPRGLQVRTG